MRNIRVESVIFMFQGVPKRAWCNIISVKIGAMKNIQHIMGSVFTFVTS